MCPSQDLSLVAIPVQRDVPKDVRADARWPEFADEDRWLTLPDIATALGVTYATAQGWVRRETLTPRYPADNNHGQLYSLTQAHALRVNQALRARIPAHLAALGWARPENGGPLIFAPADPAR